jgi:hypothetical protein
LKEELDFIFGADSPVKDDEERKPYSSTTRITPTVPSSDKVIVLVQQVIVMPGPKERGTMDKLMHLSTLTVLVLKEKVQRAGLPVSRRYKNKPIKCL